MSQSLVDGYVNERSNDFFGKDGMQWWIGEVEDNKDPHQLGRVKVRILGWYTNPMGETVKDLPTEDLPWALVLQPTDQAGNDGQGHSSGQLQPGAITMGFFFDGEESQQPVVMGVLRVQKSKASGSKPFFALTGEKNTDFASTTLAPAGVNVVTGPEATTVRNDNNSVQIPNADAGQQPNANNPSNIGNKNGLGKTTPQDSINSTPVAAADGGGPAKTLTMHLTNTMETIVKEVTGVVASGGGGYTRITDNVPAAIDKGLAALKNCVMAIATQAVAAMREWLNELAGKISMGAGLIASFTGLPAATMILIKTAIMLILKQLCILDNQILAFAMSPINSIVSLIEGALSSALSALDGLLTKFMDKISEKLQAAFQKLICKVKGIVDAVSAILKAVGAAMKIIEAWKSGKGVFAAGMDLRKLTLNDFLSILIMILNMFDLGCNRKRQNTSNKAFVPLLGSTYCAANDDGTSLMQKLGAKGCAKGSNFAQGVETAIDMVTQIYNEAEVTLTQAKTYPSGKYELNIGTPGNMASVTKEASGATTTSININPTEQAKYKAGKAAAASKGSTPASIKKAQDSAGAGAGKAIVGDHTSYPGAYTVDVSKDLCYKVTGDEIHTVNGDYHLKVTGNFHLDIGGGMFISAVGAPQVQPGATGTSGVDSKAQKHSLLFGSDVDVNCSGGTMKLQATELNMSGMTTNLGSPSGALALDSPSVNIRGGDIVLTASNTITENATTLYQFINAPPAKIAAKSGIFASVFGPVDYILLPALSGDGVIPKFTITNAKGPFIVTCAAGGCLFTVAAGIFNVAVAAGAITATASAAVSITAGAAMTLTAGAAVVIIGATISLN